MRVIPRRIALFLLVCGWVWLAERFFGSPTTDFAPRHQHGFSSLVEQFAAALYTPALLFSRGLGRGPLYLPCLFQLWPAFVLAVRPWRRLSWIVQLMIAVYGGLCIVMIAGGFLTLHGIWNGFFGP